MTGYGAKAWLSAMALSVDIADWSGKYFFEPSSDGFATVAAVHICKSKYRFLPGSSNPEYNGCQSSTATFG